MHIGLSGQKRPVYGCNNKPISKKLIVKFGLFSEPGGIFEPGTGPSLNFGELGMGNIFWAS